MAHEFKLTRRVEFSDTDLAGIVHFSAFFRWMESTEHAFYRSLGFSAHGPQDGREIGWPRVHAECDYMAPLRFEDEVEIHLLVREKNKKSLKLEFNFNNVSTSPSVKAAQGSLTVVCVDLSQNAGNEKARRSGIETTSALHTAHGTGHVLLAYK